jgi:hypothetical protein
MARNTSNGGRKGAVSNRYQRLTKDGWTKYDATTGVPLATKDEPWKGVRKK